MVLMFARDRFRSRAPTLAVLTTVVIAACDHAPKANPLGVAEPTGRLTYQDTLALGLIRPRPSGIGASPTTAAAVDPGLSYTLTPSNHLGYDQPQTIVGTVSGIANKIVLNGSGAIYCSGNYGSIIAYDSTNSVIGQTPITLADPPDCSPPEFPDTVAATTQAELNVGSGQITKFEITPMSPLSGPVWNPRDSVYVNGNFYQNYTLVVTGPTSRISVSCTPATITRASSTPVSCTASASGTLRITKWTFTATDPATGNVTSAQTTSPWTGMAVASGAVTVQGTVGGVTAISDTGRISVTDRTSGWSWSGAKSSGTATGTNFDCFETNAHYATDHFGWVRADSTCANNLLMLWPDYAGRSSARGYTIAPVPSGPNAGLWYATSDKTGMHVRLQMHWDLRPNATNKFPVTGKDTVAARCKAAGVNGQANVTVVNNTCMTDPSPFNFAAMYTFLVRHEQCHLKQFMDVFPTIADPRTGLEKIVRADTAAFHQAAAPVYDAANTAILRANTIDVASGQTYTFWSRNPMNGQTAANVTWILRPYPPNGTLAPGC